MSAPSISMAVPSNADLTVPQDGIKCPWMPPLFDISHIYFHKWYEVAWLFPINLLSKAHCRHYWVNVDEVIIFHGLTEDSYLQGNTMLSGYDWLGSYLHGNTLLSGCDWLASSWSHIYASGHHWLRKWLHFYAELTSKLNWCWLIMIKALADNIHPNSRWNSDDLLKLTSTR